MNGEMRQVPEDTNKENQPQTGQWLSGKALDRAFNGNPNEIDEGELERTFDAEGNLLSERQKKPLGGVMTSLEVPNIAGRTSHAPTGPGHFQRDQSKYEGRLNE